MEEVMVPGSVSNFATEATHVGNRVEVQQIPRNWHEIVLNAADDEHTIISENGEDIAAVISIEAYYFLQRAIAMVEDQLDLEAARANVNDYGAEYGQERSAS
ncbi:prevent-host-death family protein [Thalassoporum mexicanum PCC 7367]|uniref:prevent-host-death family protein n=1 Tax=Thalassoporum mexicanum TaxID=3457544 RepID=UPI00029F97BC|nr:prevent-host-death family protein [Pseudanabaena sp. PCC 7367]AFY68702.1 prevent-host-death family protein [Pseudanabaena sp. PCC 7367]